MPETYQHRLRRGDRIRVRITYGEEEHCLSAEVVTIIDHGHYSESLLRCDDGASRRVRLWHNAVPDDGVIECVIVKAVPRPHPEENHSLARDELIRLRSPEPCPQCERMISRKPRAGWPCWACRMREAIKSKQEATK